MGRSSNRLIDIKPPADPQSLPADTGPKGDDYVFGPSYSGQRVEGDRVILDVTRHTMQQALVGLLGFSALVALLFVGAQAGLALLAAILGWGAYAAYRWRAEIAVDRASGIIHGYAGMSGSLLERLRTRATGNILVTMTPWFQQSGEDSEASHAGPIFQLAIGTAGARTLLFRSPQRDETEALALAIAEATGLPIFRRGYRVIAVDGREEVVDPRLEVGVDPSLEVGEALAAAPAAIHPASGESIGEARGKP